MLASAEEEQTEECYTTASPNNESASATGSTKDKEPCRQNGKEVKLNCYEIQHTHIEILKVALKHLNGRYFLLGLLAD
jgi:hypothetical protein